MSKKTFLISSDNEKTISIDFVEMKNDKAVKTIIEFSKEDIKKLIPVLYSAMISD